MSRMLCVHVVRRRFGQLLWDSAEIAQNCRQTKCTEHARQKIRPSKRLGLYIFQKHDCPVQCLSTQKRLQMKIWGFVFVFAVVMEPKINFPRFSFAFAFVTIMLGKHKPQQQATLTKTNQIPEIFFRFRFRNPTERKS